MDNEAKRYVTAKDPIENAETAVPQFGTVYEIFPKPGETISELTPKYFDAQFLPGAPTSFCLFSGCAHLNGGDWVECDAEGNRIEEEG